MEWIIWNTIKRFLQYQMYISVSTNQPSEFIKIEDSLTISTIVVGNQDISVLWKIWKILNIFMRVFYLMLYPLIMVKMLLAMKVSNMLHKYVTSQIMIHPLQFMLIFQNIKYKGLMLII